MSDCGCEVEITSAEERKVLVPLLSINFSFFLIEAVAGIIAESAALLADSLDMLADAFVYGIAFYAVGKVASKKITAAYLSGVFQVFLGLLIVAEILRKIVFGSEPESLLMLIFGALALIANCICLVLISKHKHGEVHMRASWIFSKNDVIANIGILIGAALVYTTGSRFPDLVIGVLISLVVIRGGLLILKEAKQERVALSQPASNN